MNRDKTTTMRGREDNRPSSRVTQTIKGKGIININILNNGSKKESHGGQGAPAMQRLFARAFDPSLPSAF